MSLVTSICDDHSLWKTAADSMIIYLVFLLHLWLLLFKIKFLHHAACDILVPQPGIEPVPPALEGDFLAPGPPGKSWLEFHRKKASSPWSFGELPVPSLVTILFSACWFVWIFLLCFVLCEMSPYCKALCWVATKLEFSKHSSYPILLLKELSHVKSQVVQWFPAGCLISLQCRDAGSAESRERG